MKGWVALGKNIFKSCSIMFLSIIAQRRKLLWYSCFYHNILKFEEIWSYLMNFANPHHFWGELLKQRPCSWHWLHRREDWTLPPFFPDTIISPLSYQFASLPMDPFGKRLLGERIPEWPSRQQSDFLFSQSFWQLQSSAWLSVNHQGPSLFCLDLKLSERVTAIKRTLCVNRWMQNTRDK